MDIRFYLDTTPSETPAPNDGPATGAELVQKVLSVYRTKESSERYFSRFSGELVEGIQFYKDEDGLYVKAEKFIGGVPETYLAANLPIRAVTLHDTSVTGKPQLGVYQDEKGDTTAVVDQHSERRQAGRGGFMGEDQCYEDIPGWRIRVQGKNLESVEALYRAFRNSTLRPVEAWDDVSVDIMDAKKALIEHLGDILGDTAPTNATN